MSETKENEKELQSKRMSTTVQRCFVCKKKSHVLVDCCCGQQFCVNHRYHECAVVRQKELENLKKNLPVVVPSKLEKI
jgi:acetone carboxylase gamma subunit